MSSALPPLTGELWVVATPLGNPGDLSPRAREALELADLVLAEDTRRSGLLLSACGLRAKRFSSLHEHNEEAKLNALLGELAQGRKLALISDAGTPLISDPGYKLVRLAREAGYRVRPLPGPSAALTALCASGLPPLPFLFLGFPPRRVGEQRQFFAPYALLPLTLIFYERKDRVRSTLKVLHSLGGAREICLARELTKTYEEFIYFTLGEGDWPGDLLGEITVLAAPPLAQGRMPQDDLRLLLARTQEQMGAVRPRELARAVRAQAPGWSVDEIYQLLLGQSPGSKSL